MITGLISNIWFDVVILLLGVRIVPTSTLVSPHLSEHESIPGTHVETPKMHTVNVNIEKLLRLCSPP